MNSACSSKPTEKNDSTAADSGFPFARPLTWTESRRKLRTVLEAYINSPLLAVPARSRALETDFVSSWFLHDLDLYLGALPASLALLILSSTSAASRNRGLDSALNVNAESRVYTSQVIASVILVMGSLFSIFLVGRRRYTCSRDADVAIRRTIFKFLSASKEQTKEGPTDADVDRNVTQHTPKQDETDESISSLLGTSLTEIYPVFRGANISEAIWHKIPTLLLVEGDLIGLQVGDVAPCSCRMLDIADDGNYKASSVVCAGERISEAFFSDTRKSFASSFPRGKFTVQTDSRQLLTLCNNMRVFRLEDTPLEGFLPLPQGKHRLPQIHRKLRVVRKALFLFALVIFILTFAIIFVRPGVSSTDLSIILPAPFLAALGVLPVTTPASLFSLEIIGIARILVRVHPYASIRGDLSKRSSLLFLRYALAGSISRLSLQGPARRVRDWFRRLRLQGVKYNNPAPGLVHVPPASAFLLEKLGVTTAFALVDDELVCESCSAPQQLMIPSGKGLKLLDLFQTYEGDSDQDSEPEISFQRKRGKASPHDFDSDSDDEQGAPVISVVRRKRKVLRKRERRKAHMQQVDKLSPDTALDNTQETEKIEVQFEDPLWWQHLPSLKCIGLACLVADDHAENAFFPDAIQETKISVQRSDGINSNESFLDQTQITESMKHVEQALIRFVSVERQRSHLQSLAQCIGLSTEANRFGDRGDLSLFSEVVRLHMFSTGLHAERLAMDAHALGLEESRSWGMLRPDATSVIIQDRRSKAYQLLTVGDPRVVTKLCHEAWQGENSTIFPLSTPDRESILETSTNWVLADLDVAAFSYSPVSHTFEKRIAARQCADAGHAIYLVENVSSPSKDAVSEDWALVGDQIFLGVLGSSVVPRKDIERLLDVFNEAGVRFVYFSPRNMRRTKELASQMGIDVAWNCAISLRPLDEGEEDPHRMVSTYADWDVNAKLPHGIENVRRHLKEVDNVPLLVSLFTDVTKGSCREMLTTFQDYSDTVLVMGLSHLARNSEIFSNADVAIGADVLADQVAKFQNQESTHFSASTLLPHEMTFVSAISAHSCAFSLRGATSPSQMPAIIASGRAALEAATAAVQFVLVGCVAFSLFVLFCMCTVSTSIPFVPTLGSALYLQIILPLIGMAMAMSDADKESMNRVPSKNDQRVTFQRMEGRRLGRNIMLKGLLPAVLPQILHLIAFGELMIKFEPEFLATECSMSAKEIMEASWTSVIRCEGLKNYSGNVRISAGALVLSEMVVCVIVASASIVLSVASIFKEPPWARNQAWAWMTVVSIGCVAAYLTVAVQDGTFSALPWYYFILAVSMPFLCLLGFEWIKRSESRHARRAAKLRRLQFETRLGMWSPK